MLSLVSELVDSRTGQAVTGRQAGKTTGNDRLLFIHAATAAAAVINLFLSIVRCVEWRRTSEFVSE